MLKRTHLILGIFVSIYFLPYVNNKIIFVPIVLFASLIPDIDSLISPKKDNKFLRAIKSQSYKDFMHSYTLCIFLSAVLAFFYPPVALPFFLGYSFHLFFDSLTIYGINPFWPWKIKTRGLITPGGKTEKVVELVLLIFIFLLLFRHFFLP